MELDQPQGQLEIDLLHSIANQIAHGDQLDETFASLIDLVTRFVMSDRCHKYLLKRERLVPWLGERGGTGLSEHPTVAMSNALVAAFRERPVALAIEQTPEGIKFRVPEEWRRHPGETFVCVPLISRSQIVGVITLEHQRPHPYRLAEIRLLSSIAYVFGVALRISQLEKQGFELLLELETRKLVERGKGILQRDLGLSEGEAYLLLQRQSEAKQRPIKEIAQAVILSAEVRQNALPAG